ncbi:type II secretion system F family protein [Streptantibioticus parmotrematis]|uniref:type II secretion system F family protein n=1 Tax=Streptantibioticus parmotrematis TaxID=2873249 RepID=UPI0033C7638E
MSQNAWALLAAVCTLGLLGAVFAAVQEARGRIPDPSRPPSRLKRRWQRAQSELPAEWRRRYRWLAAVAAAAAIVVWAVSGWPVNGLLAAGAVLGLPYLLQPGGAATARIERLEALAQWLRHLAGVHTAGVSLNQTIEASAKAAAGPVAPQVRALAGRLRARQDPVAAYGQFADDFGDGVVDHIVLLLQSHATLRGEGLSGALEAMADSIGRQARDARDIEADRAKVRASARWVSLFIVFVVAVCLLNHSYSAPYDSVFGQILLIVLGAAFWWALSWLRRIARSQPEPRLLGPEAAASYQKGASR